MGGWEMNNQDRWNSMMLYKCNLKINKEQLVLPDAKQVEFWKPSIVYPLGHEYVAC